MQTNNNQRDALPDKLSGPHSVVQASGHSYAGPGAWAAAGVLALAIGVLYGPALTAPFIFDDLDAIITNRSITSLWPLVGTRDHPGPLNPEEALPTAGRPLVNLTFALNYYLGELNPVGYHAGNVLIHFASALLLWAIVRRTLRLPYFAGRFDASAGWLALAAALLWALHPLQTEAVIYATQRTELMMAFVYLATLYCSLRYWSQLPLPPGEGRGEGALERQNFRRRVWLTLAVCACAAGMASKEVMVSAPLIVLLFERTFIAGSVANALRRSWPLYLGLAATLVLLLALNINAPRRHSAGFGLGPPVWNWWLTQSQALVMYFKLVVWPSPLLIYYQWPYLATIGAAWMYLAPILVLGIATLILLWRNRPLGFLGTWVFAILAPTTIVPIPTEMAAERRMYLPLAAIAVLFVLASFSGVRLIMTRQTAGRQNSDPKSSPILVGLIPALLVAITFVLLSANRLEAYSDEITLWQQVLRHQPSNSLAHYNLGMLLNHAGREEESFAELQAAIQAKPDFPNALSAFGFALTHRGQFNEALDVLHAALAIEPGHVAALNNLGLTLTEMGRAPEAIEPLEHALKLNPDFVEARINLSRALTNMGRQAQAIEMLRSALALNPDDPTALNYLGTALAVEGRLQEAIESLERAVTLRPDFVAARNTLAIALYRSGDVRRAIHHFRRNAEFNPNDVSAYCNLGNVYLEQGDIAQAVAHYTQAVQLQPNFADAQFKLGVALNRADRAPDAIGHLRAALKFNPQILPAYVELAQALADSRKLEEAIAVARQGIETARTSGQEKAALEIEQWLARYPSVSERDKGASPNVQSSPEE
jgi:tetratricopeptide (TPR) repeat protein